MLEGAEGSDERLATVTLPHTFTEDTFHVLMDGLFNGDQDLISTNIVLDFTKLARIQVGGVAVLSNVIEAAKRCGGEVRFEGLEECDAADFLLGSGFAAEYILFRDQFASPGNEFAPLKLVQYSRSASYIGEEMIPWLAAALRTNERSLASIRLCLEEAFNNIKDHSEVLIGCCCAHHDVKAKQIIICISDFGVGIPVNVRTKAASLSDDRAIAKACEMGFTTGTPGRNMGAGLHHLVQNIVSLHGGVARIYSGRGSYTCVRDRGRVKGTPRTSPAFYPGTVIRMILDTTKVSLAKDEEEFEW